MLHMSQKDYNIKIINALLKSENHIRGLARLLNTNQTTIARKVKELYENNIVDFKQVSDDFARVAKQHIQYLK